MRFACASLLLAAVGCVPIAPPYQVFETAETLKAREVALTAAGGAGYYGDPHVGDPNKEGLWGGGVGARARVGVADGHEVGLEAAASISGNREIRDDFGATVFGAKLSWKAALGPYVALVAGFGFGEYLGRDLDGSDLSHTALGGDLALIASPERPLGGVLRPYGALRGQLSGVVLTADKRGSRTPEWNVDPGLLLAAGLSVEPSKRLRLYAEVGVGFSWACDKDGCDTFDNRQNYGLYGGVGAAYVFGR